MHRSKLTVLAIAAFAVAVVGLTGASAATGQSGRLQAAPGGGGSLATTNFVSLGSSNKMTTYILEMYAKPVAAVDVASRAAGHGALSFAQKAALTRQISKQQASVVAAVQQLKGAVVTSRFQGVYNGIAVALPQREAVKLQSISGVKAIFAAKTYKMDTVAPGDGLPVINAPQTWGGLGNYQGTGIKVADLDTGIDYTHADFAGTGTTAAFNCAAAHSTDDTTQLAIDCPGVSNWTDGSKIKGGIDLVGDNYNANSGSPSYQPIPHPDPNPLDCNGHGSHTAGTIAGDGVDANGNTYTGSYDASTINNTDFVIPPGVAPKALLYGVRVFGCSGSVDDAVLLDAMNWSYNNGMDVVNMSLGSSFGSPTDPDSVAADNLAKLGVITVLSAGNSGPNPYLVGSPSDGVGALSVAANDSTASFPAANLTITKADTTSGGTLVAIDANGVSIPSGPFTVRVIHTDGGAFNSAIISRGCSVADDEAQNGGAPWPANTILVVRRGTCARVGKAIYARDAGAAAVIMVNNSTGLPPYEGPITSNPDTGAAVPAVTIPFLGVRGGSNPSTSAAGVQLMAADGGSISLAATSIANPGYLGLASFSSWGPTTGGLMKPEVTAPGVSILSAGVGRGNGGVFFSGTSMAAPHTTGTAALVKQAHGNWANTCGSDCVKYYKGAIENTTNPAMNANSLIRGGGAGEIDAYNATHTGVVALGSPDGTASLSFGQPDMLSKFEAVLPITLTNFTGTKQVFAVSSIAKQGVRHTVIVTTPNSNAPSKVYVPAHGTATVTVDLTVYKANAADAVTAFGDWWGSRVFDDAGGLIHFRPLNGGNKGISLNVPYYTVPTAASNIAIDGISSAALKNGATDNNVMVRNKGGIATGYADWFSWGGKSDPSQSDLGSADLLNDGVSSTGFTGNNAASFVTFAAQVSQAWRNPAANVIEFDVDVNNDGTPDYYVFSYDHGQLTAGSVDGEAVTFVQSATTGQTVFHYLTGALFNGKTAELTARFSDLCLANTPCLTQGTPIHYSTYTQDRNGGTDSITNNASYDPYAPSFTEASGGETVVPANHQANDPVTINQAAWSANPQLGILVLAQNNQGGAEGLTFSLSF